MGRPGDTIISGLNCTNVGELLTIVFGNDSDSSWSEQGQGGCIGSDVSG